MPELLLEILSEEIPARMQARAADDLKRLVTDGLKAAGLEFTSAESYVTPRRLALVVDGLPREIEGTTEERRGPNVNAPEQAINGFKGSLPEGAKIEERETPKGTFFFAIVDKPSEKTFVLLFGILQEQLANLPWPKSMTWRPDVPNWVRPIRSVLALFDGKVVDFDFRQMFQGDVNPLDFYGERANYSDQTYGHRFLAPDAITVTDFADYKTKLRAAKVMLDPAERREKIEADAKKLCEKEGLSLKDDPGLLDEVTGLVEWPVVLMGTIDAPFMELPDEVLSTSMRSHQKYFSTLGADGKLAARFIVVANTETKDGGKQVVAGNERVLRARLSDAKFFWDQDRSIKLEDRVDALMERVFHAKLGTVFDKVGRVEELAVDLVGYITPEQESNLRQAARLAKADLSTGMVGEFPELQGIMGRYYAQHDAKDADVCDAIAEHYSPLGPNDSCPTQFTSIWVALADKIDTLVGFFAIDERPTGSKDPFALRRAALGVIRLVLENGLRLSLKEAFAKSFLLQPESVKHAYKNMMEEAFRTLAASGEEVDLKEKGPDQDISYQILAFFADRLKVHLREQGVRHDLIDAVFALGGEDDLVRLIKRVEALQEFLKTEDGENLLTAYKRAANILRAEEKKDGTEYRDAPDPSMFREDPETALGNALDLARPAIETAIEGEDFARAMLLLAGLRAPVDTFFDDVTVNADDAALRVNRLKLLNGIRSALDGVADFSKIEGK